jgi:hypothetical protein
MNHDIGLLRDPGRQVPQRVDSRFVTYRLEEAGATLLALPATGFSTRLRSSRLDFATSAAEAFGQMSGYLRPPVPSASRITRMDEALGWILLIPQERFVIRRIVGARCLVSPLTERHLYSWRRLGAAVGADHKAVQRWHAQGIDMLVAAVGALQAVERRATLPCPAHGAADAAVRAKARV